VGGYVDVFGGGDWTGSLRGNDCVPARGEKEELK